MFVGYRTESLDKLTVFFMPEQIICIEKRVNDKSSNSFGVVYLKNHVYDWISYALSDEQEKRAFKVIATDCIDHDFICTYFPELLNDNDQDFSDSEDTKGLSEQYIQELKDLQKELAESITSYTGEYEEGYRTAKHSAATDLAIIIEKFSYLYSS